MKVDGPWEPPNSHFTLLFEGYAMLIMNMTKRIEFCVLNYISKLKKVVRRINMNSLQVSEEIMNLLKKIIPDENGLPVSKDENISEFFDSVKLVQLIIELEGKYNISFSDDDFEVKNFSTINKIADLVSSYISKN